MHLSLTRLARGHAAAMLEQITHGKALPPEVVDQILVRTDGVPPVRRGIDHDCAQVGPASGSRRLL
jgi:hypothetical protein